MIVQANLNNLFKGCGRADEEMIDNVRRAIKRKLWDVYLEKIITGVDKVYDSLKIGYDKKYFDDISNFSIVRFNFKIYYTNTDKTQAIR